MDTFPPKTCKNGEDIQLGERFCFLTILENDLQAMFDSISGDRVFLNIKTSLKESKNILNGDFFLSLKAIPADLLNNITKLLLEKIKTLNYIYKVHVDKNQNLFVHLNRLFVFQCTFKQVEKSQEKYGMLQLPYTYQSYFVMVHNEKMNEYNSLRVELIADHMISFLVSNGAAVICNRNSLLNSPEISLNSSSFVCNDLCFQEINVVCESIISSSKESEWKEDLPDKSNCIQLNGHYFVEKHSQSHRFGKEIGVIKIFSDKCEVVQKCAFIAHCFRNHGVNSKNTVHVNLYRQKHKLFQSSCLNEMLNLTETCEDFINCQDVHVKNQDDLSVKTCIEYIKKDILKAVSDRCKSETLKLEMVSILVDTAIKFIFLKAGTNAPLKINFSCDNYSRKYDGIFVQYNFARLCKLLNEFQLHVEKGYYEKLPKLCEIDFSLLREKEEWELLKFILFFPRLVQNVFYSINSKENFYSNKICIMLDNLTHSFSLYYSRIHILTNPQPQLQKVMHARIWLLKSVYQLMCNSFAMINIKGLNQM